MREVSFWQSNLLLTITTAVVGLVAYFLYIKQKIDKKKDAANIIMLEVKRAEAKLKEARKLATKRSLRRSGTLQQHIL